MRILLVSKFLHYVGGVETYLRWVSRALVDHGHDVGLVGMAPPTDQPLMELPDAPLWLTPTRSYEKGAADRARSAATSVWSVAAGKVMRTALAEFSPDVVHFHGTCYQLTPAVVREAMLAGVPPVLTAHEYKLICANQTLYDDVTQKICVACVGASQIGKVTAPLARSCMKGSRAVTLLGATEGRVSERVWRRADPLILAPSNFMRHQLISDGWSPERVQYLDLPWRPDGASVAQPTATDADSVVFVGRLAALKGAHRLLEAWADVAPGAPHIRLRILGDGAQRADLERIVKERQLPRVTFLGHCTPAQVQEELRHAVVTAHPSQCHENSPFSVRESLMAGVPAIVSNVGGMPEMVGPNSGWVVAHDDPGAWSATLSAALTTPRVADGALRAEVLARAVTEGDHLGRLVEAYETRRALHYG